MKRYFHDELEQLRSSLILIGEKAAYAGRMAIDGYLENDLEKTEAAIALDDEIDALEVEIDRLRALHHLRSPVSTDVRLIFVAIKASHDLERAGDEAHNIAKRTRNILLRDSKTLCTESIAEMSQIAFSMMQDAITCFLDEDCEMAKRIIATDEEVDKINKENSLRLASKDASQYQDNSTQIETIFISKSIEWIADHAKNLAEEVIYLLEGNLDSIINATQQTFEAQAKALFFCFYYLQDCSAVILKFINVAVYGSAGSSCYNLKVPGSNPGPAPIYYYPVGYIYPFASF